MTSPELEVRNVYKSYDEGRIEALRGVDLSLPPASTLPSPDPVGAVSRRCCTC